MKPLALNTVVLDNNARTTNNLTGVALPIDFAKSRPGSEDLGVADLDEVDLVFGAKGLDELDVFRFCTCLDENAKVGLAFVEGFGSLTKAPCETVANKRILQNLLKTTSV